MRIVALLDGGAERMRGEAVTPDYFDTLGIRPLRGRLLGAEDNRPDAPRVLVLSHRTWVTCFGAADVVGRPFRTSREVYTIAGVAPPGFSGSIEDDVVEFWMPLPQYEPAGVLQDRFARAAWARGVVRARASGGWTIPRRRRRRHRLADAAAVGRLPRARAVFGPRPVTVGALRSE